MRKIFLFISCLIVLLLLIIYSPWFINPQIIGGDWPFFFEENVKAFGFSPPVWSPMQVNGFGGPVLVYALDSYLYFTGWLFTGIFQFPWIITYKIFWFGMFLCIGAFSLGNLFKQLLPKLPLPYLFLGIFIYLANTYILMVVGGGQMGVGLGYAIAPLVVARFITLTQWVLIGKKQLVFSLIAGLVFALQVMFDFRIAYLTLIIVLVYICVFYFANPIKNKVKVLLRLFVFVLLIPIFITCLLHAFWLLPVLFIGSNSIAQLGSAYTSSNAVSFFSFAKFENAISLLHPNWPENIFGKIGFMKPEYLLLPILGFASLLFIGNKKEKRNEKYLLLFFSALALLGAFLAKGANEPFGGIYIWLFETIPGFTLFRDPTKFYLFIALAYAVLIPFGVYAMSLWLSTRIGFKKAGQIVITIAFLFYFAFLIRPSLLGQLHGTFARHQIPNEYVQLKNVLVRDTEFSRTLWVPRMQRFAFTDQNHPSVEASFLFKATNSAEVLNIFKQKDTHLQLQNSSIKYVIIPNDSEKEIFLKDRMYDHKERKLFETELDKIGWLSKNKAFQNLSVYQIADFKDHFWLEKGGKLTYEKVSNSEYIIHIEPTAPGKLIFVENYSPYWNIEVDNHLISSKKYGQYMSFELPASGKSSSIKVKYELEQRYIVGRIISLISFFVILTGLIVFYKKKK